MALAQDLITTGSSSQSAGFIVSRHPLSAPGHLLTVLISLDSSAFMEPVSSGWTLIAGTTPPGFNSAGLFALRRVVQLGDPLDYSFSCASPTGRPSWTCLVFDGQDTVTPINVAGTVHDTSPASTSATANGATTTAANCIIVASFAAGNRTNMTPPAGMTEKVDFFGSSSTYFLGVATVLQAVAGASGNKVATLGSSETSVGLLFAVAPDTNPVSCDITPIPDDEHFELFSATTIEQPTDVDELIAEPTPIVRYVVTMRPLDTVTGDRLTKRHATLALNTDATDTPAKVSFTERLVSDWSLDRTLWDGSRMGGPARMEPGVLKFLNEGDLDGYADLSFDGASIEISLGGTRRGQSPIRIADYRRVGTYVGRSALCEGEYLVVQLRDLAYRLETNLLTAFYAESDGVELNGKAKPLPLGVCRNFKPAQVDYLNRVYEVCGYGAVTQITAIYDRAYKLEASQYTLDEANGRFTLLYNPNGEITCDVIGLAAAGQTKGSIIKWICTTDGTGPLAWPNEVEQDSFLAFDALETDDVGRFFGEQTTRNAALAYFLAPDGFAVQTRDGLMRIGRIPSLLGDVALQLPGHKQRATPAPERVDLPAKALNVAYGRAWMTQSASDIADTVLNTEHGRFVEQEWRLAPASDDSVIVDYPSASIVDLIEAPYDTLAAATAAAQRLFERFKLPWEMYVVDAGFLGYYVDLADLVTVAHRRFGLVQGKTFVVLGTRDTPRGVLLTIWRTKPVDKLLAEDGDVIVTEDDEAIIA